MSMQLSTFQTPYGNDKAKNQHWMFARFFWRQKYRHCMLAKEVLIKHSLVIFGIVYSKVLKVDSCIDIVVPVWNM